MNEPPNRYDVTVTVARDGGYLPGPAEFAVAAGQAASSRNASVMSAHTAEHIISVVTVQTADRSAAVAVALPVVSEALKCPSALPSRRADDDGQPGVVARRTWYPDGPRRCPPAPQRHMAHVPAVVGDL